MSLTTAPVPLAVARAFEEGLAEFVPPGGSLWTLLRQRNGAHAVHNLDLNQIAAGIDQQPPPIQNLTTATGWRFLAADAASGLTGACHVGGASPKLTGLSTAPPVRGVVELIRQLEKMDVVNAGDFELRVLRVTWLHFEAFWLHPTGEGEDFVVPYAGFVESPDDDLQLMYPHTAPDFLTLIWARARRYLALVADARAAHPRERPARAARAVLGDVNKATADQLVIALDLTDLEAGKIVQHCKDHGRIERWEHLINIRGVNRAKLDAKKGRIGFGFKL